MSCPNCPCSDCVAERAAKGNEEAWRRLYNQQYGLPDPGPPCAYDQIAKDYAARGEPMPAALYLYCPCRRCNPICL